MSPFAFSRLTSREISSMSPGLWAMEMGARLHLCPPPGYRRERFTGELGRQRETQARPQTWWLLATLASCLPTNPDFRQRVPNLCSRYLSHFRNFSVNYEGQDLKKTYLMTKMIPSFPPALRLLSPVVTEGLTWQLSCQPAADGAEVSGESVPQAVTRACGAARPALEHASPSAPLHFSILK